MTEALTIDRAGIQQIFAERKTEIEDEEREVKIVQASVDSEMADLVSEFQSRLNLLVQRRSIPGKPRMTYVMKKLPLFGRTDNLEFKDYFEFPNQENFNKMYDADREGI